MSKKTTTKKNISTKSKKTNEISLNTDKNTGKPVQAPAIPGMPDIDKLPEEAKKKLEKIKEKLDKFSKAIVTKFDKYVVGVGLLPPGDVKLNSEESDDVENQEKKKADENKEQKNPDNINIVVLIDDNDSQKMTKEELKTKLSTIIFQMAQEIDKNLQPQTVILSELWQSCYDCKYDILRQIAMSAPVYDTGMMAAIKISELHKSMVLKKFEKYIVSYVLAGSLTRGQATKTSDIDVFIVIDDTDVKKMTRAELKDKLRAIILSMGYEAGQMTGIQNKINIQVYILTDFWDSLKEANPVIFTLLRDGVPFYDRGIFMPWKQLLRMGRIKPSAEAIDMFMSSGEQMLKRVELKIKDIGMEDIYYAILTPSQAAVMMYGMAPPAPRETAQLMEEIFVKKEKIFDKKLVDILDYAIKVRKELEHGSKKEISGAEIDKMLADSKKYLEEIKELFKKIEKIKQDQDILHIYESIVTLVRDALKVEGINKCAEKEVLSCFEQHLIEEGKIPAKFKRMLEGIIKAKADYDAGKLTSSDVENTKKNSRELIKFVIEYIQRKKGRELEQARLKIKHGEKFGEVLMLNELAFIVHDTANLTQGISKATVDESGNLTNISSSNIEEMEKAITDFTPKKRISLKPELFVSLKNIFGIDVEIFVN